MNIASKFFANKVLAFPYIQINGAITRQTTIFVDNMIKRLPSKTKKLAIVINSDSGSLSQAHIINTKLNILSETKGIQLYTFVEDYAINAGFLIASNGHKIFADTTSIVGGLEVSTSKVILNQMIRRISYNNQPSLSSQINHSQKMNPNKKQQLKRVFNVFSSNMDYEIKKKRKIDQKVDLLNVYSTKQAKQLGLIDEIGRINRIIPQMFPEYQAKRMQQSAFDKVRNDLKKLNFW